VDETAGAKASASAGRGFDGLAEIVLLFCAIGLEGDSVREAGSAVDLVPESCNFVENEVLTLRVPFGVNPKPPRDVRAVGFALSWRFLATAELNADFPKLPSLVLGRLLALLPLRLEDEPGLGGGPMGLSGAKKLDLRRSFGVVGIACKLSMVRSDRDGRDGFLVLGVGSSGAGSTYSSGSTSSLKPCLEAARKPLREPSRS
jgi:hypothetical protein